MEYLSTYKNKKIYLTTSNFGFEKCKYAERYIQGSKSAIEACKDFIDAFSEQLKGDMVVFVHIVCSVTPFYEFWCDRDGWAHSL
jgi:hypothetical protein